METPEKNWKDLAFEAIDHPEQAEEKAAEVRKLFKSKNTGIKIPEIHQGGSDDVAVRIATLKPKGRKDWKRRVELDLEERGEKFVGQSGPGKESDNILNPSKKNLT